MPIEAPFMYPDPAGDRRRAVESARRSVDKARDAIQARDLAIAWAVRKGAPVAEVAEVVGLAVEEVQTAAGPAWDDETAIEARRRQALKLVAHATMRRDDAENQLRAAIAFAVELGVPAGDLSPGDAGDEGSQD